MTEGRGIYLDPDRIEVTLTWSSDPNADIGASTYRTSTPMWCLSCRKVVNVDIEIERRPRENRRITHHTCENGHFIRSVEEPLFPRREH